MAVSRSRTIASHFAAWSARLPIRLIANRLLLAIPVLFGVTLLTFFILDLLPGNAAQQLLGADASPEQVARMEMRLHLDRPAAERYLLWLKDTLSGDLGRSLASQQRVTELLEERLPITLELLGYAFALSLCMAIPAALLAARWPGGFFDRATLALSMAGVSVANYVLALVLVLGFAVHLPWFPSFGFASLERGLLQNVRSITLPALAIAFPLISFYTRFLRGDLLEQLRREEYIATALAKGLGPWRVLIRHALRNSLFGLLTLVGLNFGALLGGTVIIEQIFALPGIGQLLVQSINTRDIAIVQALVLLLAVGTTLANLLVDVTYAVLDPRLRHGHR